MSSHKVPRAATHGDPASTDPPGRAERLRRLRGDVAALRDRAQKAEDAAATAIAEAAAVHRSGATNLVHYLALRSKDLRPLQRRLTAEGLSSLGRMESGVRRNLDAILRMLGESRRGDAVAGDASAGDDSELRANAAALLGGIPDGRSTRIMVTLPSRAADDGALVAAFAAAGMDVARINSAHDGPDTWLRMAAHVRAAGRGIPIAVDLAGPKLRTGPIAPGPRVVRARPRRDELGRAVAPALLVLHAERSKSGGPAPDRAEDEAQRTARDEASVTRVPVVEAGWLAGRTVGEQVRFTDARGRRRRLPVVGTDAGEVVLASDRTSYLATGLTLTAGEATATVGALAPVAQALRVHLGDAITLTDSLEPVVAGDGPEHVIGCTLPEALEAVRAGQRIAFDDGRIEGVVESTGAGRARVSVTQAGPRGTRLRAGKGINLPDTDIDTPALTEADRAALDAVIDVADIVQLSFVRTAADVRLLLDALDELAPSHPRAADIGVVVKIETRRGFANLPEILLELMRRPRVGVMIARGDLGVEAGFERLAEVQEEILWICEAARVPAIWATQVLETLAARGIPTRAEVTDAAAGVRAECVMLNKGPYIVEAIRALDDILRRMHGHLQKKRPLLRRLAAWQRDG
ncbi:pyruvate kinase [Microbacterium sp. BWT-B31]|uniref:pyruvate kinase n=1 Tax=Microbacterium sp. BWT-B31 TaxID=3232072 RepID=UPI003527F0B3